MSSDFRNEIEAKLFNVVQLAIEQPVGPIDAPAVWADNRLDAVNGDIDLAIARLIKESVAASSSSGAILSFGGFSSMIVTLPINVGATLVINVRLAAAIAHLRGYSLTDPLLHYMIAIVATGTTAQSAMSEIGVQLGKKFGEQLLKTLPIETIRKINKRVGFLLVTKYGTKKGVITLGRAIPVVSAVLGGTVDGLGTLIVGRAAKKTFTQSMNQIDSEL
jgi:hypothetical protein